MSFPPPHDKKKSFPFVRYLGIKERESKAILVEVIENR
jgi:hypothetical protein